MSRFLDLPLELIPAVLSQIIKPHHLALCCLVNKTFLSFTVPQLYERIYVYAWHKEGKAKVTKLFKTLAEHPELARWVKKLELRDFPKAFSSDSYQSLSKTCLLGLANCSSLRSCTWTRDQTLSTEILSVLSFQCPELQELEINGHAAGIYDPNCLLRFRSLSKISLIMPSADVIDVLPAWMENTRKTLTALHILCKSSNLITDATLERLAPCTKRLTHLHLAGCPRVTHKGINMILFRNASRVESLALEGLSSILDLEALAQPLPSLTSLTLTVPPNAVSDIWSPALLTFLKHSPLTDIHIYVMSGHAVPDSRLLGADFIASFLAHHATRLRKFSVHRLALQPSVIGSICASCPRLESLFVVVNDNALDDLVPELARSHSLRNIHINFPHSTNGARLQPTEILAIARKIGSCVQQLGFANRVYQINRVARRSDTGELFIDTELAGYEHPEVPEQFLVVRT